MTPAVAPSVTPAVAPAVTPAVAPAVTPAVTPAATSHEASAGQRPFAPSITGLLWAYPGLPSSYVHLSSNHGREVHITGE